jgi:DNA (cytosine-5)-methyltransferase 1
MWPTPRVGGEEGYETVKERKGHTAAVQHNLLAAVQHSQMFPTPQANEDAAGTPECKMQRMLGNCEEVRGKTKEEWATGTLNPTWVEWLMGWPIGWTDLNALETDKFLTWPHSHGDS